MIHVIYVLSAPVQGAETFRGDRFYIGDPHAHTGLSGDGAVQGSPRCGGECGTLAGVFATARRNGLDWVALSDHVNAGNAADPERWSDFHETLLDASEPGVFVAVPAGEIALGKDGDTSLGHRTLLLFGDNGALRGLQMEEISFRAVDATCADLYPWAVALQAARGPLLLIPHHPAVELPSPVDWSCHYPELEPAAEVYSEHGNSLDDDFRWDAPANGAVPAGAVETAIDPDGYALRLGFMGGTDSHDTNPGSVCALDGAGDLPTEGGLTVVVLPEDAPFDRAAIYGALRRRSVYATTGPSLPVEVTYLAADAHLAGLGEDFELPEDQPLTIQIAIPEEASAWITEVRAVHPAGEIPLDDAGGGVWRATIPPEEAPPMLYVEILLDGGSWYAGDCADGGDDDQERIWLSPSWITLVEADPAAPDDPPISDDPGTASPGRCGASLLPGLTWLWGAARRSRVRAGSVQGSRRGRVTRP